jgi:hypothetical protein
MCLTPSISGGGGAGFGGSFYGGTSSISADIVTGSGGIIAGIVAFLGLGGKNNNASKVESTAPPDVTSSANPETATGGSGSEPPFQSPGNTVSPEPPKKPNLEQRSENFFRNNGIEDIEGFKDDYYTRRHGNSDLFVNKNNGEIYVVPRRADQTYLYDRAIPTGEFVK